MDTLARIKRLVLWGQVLFTLKAQFELEEAGLSEEEVVEAILSADEISKTLRSRNPQSHRRELLYVIEGDTFDGVTLYTKGKILHDQGEDVFYVLISSKRSTA